MSDQNEPPPPDSAMPAQPQDAAVPAENIASAPADVGMHVTVTATKDVNGPQIAQGGITNNNDIKYSIGTLVQLGASLEAERPNIEAVASLLGMLGQRPDANTPRPPRSENMPDTEEEVSHWFCTQLTLAERCQVRATAILHGAPAHLVARAARELMESFRPSGQDGKAETLPPTPREEDMGGSILERSFVTIRRSDNVRRVYWNDADENGFSSFGLRVLGLLAREIEGSGGFRSENSLHMIETWVASGEGELAVRSANALGVIWWDLDGKSLPDRIRRWANSAVSAERMCAPLLAVGAFAAEWGQRNVEARLPPSQLDTQRMLDDISYRALHDPTIMPQTLAVSTAYSLIGLEWTSQALDGLDYLLGLDISRGDDAPDIIPFKVCLPALVSYMQLAATGLMRPVLARLGIRARMLIRRSETLTLDKEARRRENRRKDRLLNTHLAFFFTLDASAPLPGKKWPHYGEKEKLEDRPKISQNRDGRDVLLDGVLSVGEAELCLDVQSLLWTSLASDTRELARETLRRWIEVIAISSLDPQDSTAIRGQAFFVSLDARLRAWDGAAGFGGFEAPTTRYRRYIEQWASSDGNEINRAVSRIAQRALSVFPPLSAQR